jgi:hypothetical protein
MLHSIVLLCYLPQYFMTIYNQVKFVFTESFIRNVLGMASVALAIIIAWVLLISSVYLLWNIHKKKIKISYDSIPYFLILGIEIIIIILAGMVLDGGHMLYGVIFLSIFFNMALLLCPNDMKII